MKHVIMMLLAIVLVGCGSMSKKEIEKEYVTEYVTVTVPKDFRKRCKATKPIEPTEYVSMTPQQREEYLTDYAITLLGDLRDCDKTRSGIIELVDRNNNLYKDNLNERKPKD